MQLPLSEGRVPRLVQLASVPSTNRELVRRAGSERLPAFTTLVTDDQTAGLGRRGRTWTAPAGASLAVSVLLRPVDPDGVAVPLDRYAWLSLAAGLAMADAVADALPDRDVGLKWPNDVQISGRKVCGVLGELFPGGDGVVMGAGVNLRMSEAGLPVPTATSLVIEGAAADDLEDRILSRYLERLVALVTAYGEQRGDADASGLRPAVVARCVTLGRTVRAELPGDGELQGRAVGIDASGRLEIRTESGRVEAIAAGDVIHLR